MIQADTLLDMKYSVKEINNIKFIEIDNGHHLKVTLSSMSASIYRVIYKNKEMVLAPKDLNVFHKSYKFYGKTIGRIAGRVPKGLINIDGINYQLDQNEGSNSLHGGEKGISFRNYQVDIVEDDNNLKVIFILSTSNMEEGYPGNTTYTISYIFDKYEDVFTLHYHVISDNNTYYNLTNHTYFLLDDINNLNHKLRIDIKEVSIFNDKDFTIKDFKEIKDYPLFDFSRGVILKDVVEDPSLNSRWLNGLDHRFIFDNSKDVILSNKDIRLIIHTSLSAVHIYSSGGAGDDIYIDNFKDEHSKAIALEFSYPYPKYYKKNEAYDEYVRYEFK